VTVQQYKCIYSNFSKYAKLPVRPTIHTIQLVFGYSSEISDVQCSNRNVPFRNLMA